MTRFRTLFLALTLIAGPIYADAPEVEAAREAAVRHNDSIDEAQAQLEREIERARAAYNTRVIAAKQRMIEDLRRAYRTAIRGDTPENATKIADQIARIEAQIAALQPVAKPEAPADGGLAGLDPRLVGVLVIDHPGAVRVYNITATGRLTVVSDEQADQGRRDVGAEYQGVVRNGYFIVHFSRWTFKGGLYEKGRVQMIKVDDQGRLEQRHGSADEFERTGMVHGLHHWPLADIHFPSLEAMQQARGDRPNPPAEDDDNPHDIDEDFVDVEDDTPAEDPDGIEFFGVPVK